MHIFIEEKKTQSKKKKRSKMNIGYVCDFIYLFCITTLLRNN
jgi:hypothetical protein